MNLRIPAGENQLEGGSRTNLQRRARTAGDTSAPSENIGIGSRNIPAASGRDFYYAAGWLGGGWAEGEGWGSQEMVPHPEKQDGRRTSLLPPPVGPPRRDIWSTFGSGGSAVT